MTSLDVLLFVPILSFFVVANAVVAAYLLLVAFPLAIVHLIKKHQSTKSRIILVALDSVSIISNMRTNGNLLVIKFLISHSLS